MNTSTLLGGIKKNNKLCNMKVTLLPIVIGPLGTVTKEVKKGFEGLKIKRRVETNQNYSIIEIGQDT